MTIDRTYLLEQHDCLGLRMDGSPDLVIDYLLNGREMDIKLVLKCLQYGCMRLECKHITEQDRIEAGIRLIFSLLPYKQRMKYGINISEYLIACYTKGYPVNQEAIMAIVSANAWLIDPNKQTFNIALNCSNKLSNMILDSVHWEKDMIISNAFGANDSRYSLDCKLKPITDIQADALYAASGISAMIQWMLMYNISPIYPVIVGLLAMLHNCVTDYSETLHNIFNCGMQLIDAID